MKSITSFFEIRSPKLPDYILRDSIKWTLAPTKLILEGVNLWPEKQSVTFNILFFVNMSIMGVAHAAYFLCNITNLTKMASSCTTITTTIQGMVKMAALIYHRNELQKTISTICHEFWPSEIMDNHLRTTTKRSSRYYVALASPIVTLGGLGCYAFQAYPLVFSDKDLPLMSLFPFDYTQSPFYELLYVWQYFTNFVMLFIIGGFEYIFMSLVWNCIAQMKIIRSILLGVVQQKGKQEDKRRKEKDIQTIHKNFKKFINKDSELKILLECIKHHMKVIKVCRKIEQIFSQTVLYLYLNSIIAICVSSFVASLIPSQIGKMLPYCVSDIGQFYLYAELGNELLYQSAALPDAAFHCGWHLSDNMQLRKLLIFFIMRSQQVEKLTIGGFTTLDLNSFLGVLRTSFSFYTLLNKMLEKKKEIM